jgi:uncharacterized protein (DUF433 family)
MNVAILNRITININVSGGKPSIRNMRFTVAQMLELLASGMTTTEILEDYDYIEEDDINACLLYASQMMNTKKVLLAAA